MRCLFSVLGLLVALLGSLAQAAPAAQAAGCHFQLGFATIAGLIPQQVGQCVDDEGHNPANGDGLQHSTNGLLVWRKADNWTAFTNGYWTWINGPYGLAKRLNTQRFSWEANPDGLPPADVLTAAPPPAAPAAPAQSVTFGDGTYRVGPDVRPGTYRTRTGSSGCYWARLHGFGGDVADILANTNTNFPTIVTISPNDQGFQSAGCGTWTSNLSAITASPTAPLPDGVYIVGTDVAPGTWKSAGKAGCYWARLKDFGGSTDSISANGNTDSPAIVTITNGDQGFRSEGCGTWTKIG